MDLTFNNKNYRRKDIKIEMFGDDFTNYIYTLNYTYNVPSEVKNAVGGTPAAFGLGTPERTGNLIMSDAGFRKLNKIAQEKGLVETFADLVGYVGANIENNIIVTVKTFDNSTDEHILYGVNLNTFSFGMESETIINQRDTPFTFIALKLNMG